MKLFVTLTTLLLLVRLHAETQASASTELTLEALCSADGAGVRWTVPKTGLTLENLESLSYTCRDVASDEQTIWTSADDQCFQKINNDADVVLILPQLPKDDRSMFHTVSSNLPFGTVCEFTAKYGDLFDDYQLQANCTVGDSGTTVLPASCTFLDDTEECQCSCNEGFVGNADNNIVGNVCHEEATESPTTIESGSSSQEVISVEVTPTVVLGITVALSSEISESSPPESLHTHTISTSSPVELSTSSFAMPSASSQPDSSIISPPESLHTLMISTSSPVESSTSSTFAMPSASSQPDSSTSPTHPPNNNEKLALSIIPIAIIIVSVVIVVLVFIECRKYKLKRKHEKLAMPFYELRFERIDPDFNPIKIDAKILVSESMHSIFHTFGSLDNEQDSEEKQTEATSKKDYPTENDNESVTTETNSFTENEIVMDTESEETILTDEQVQHSSDASSGYVTDSVIYDSLCQQTSNYLKYESTIHQSEQFKAVASTFSNDVKLPVAKMEMSQSEYIQSGMILHNGCQGVHSIDIDYPGTESESGYITASQLTTGCVTDLDQSSYSQSIKATDYILPSFCTPDVHFNFPKDMM